MVHSYWRGPDPRLDELWLGGLIERILQFGWAGVELFFVLSGLLVTSMLLDRKRRSQPLKPFYARRLARIVPAYLIVISLVAALSPIPLGPMVDPIVGEAASLWPYYALFLNNYFGVLGIAADNAEKALGPMWSVATEMQFYMLWPPLVMALSERRLKLALIAALLVCIALRLTAISADIPAKTIYVASLTHLDGIIIGSILALHWDRIGKFARTWAAPGLAVSIAAMVAYFWQAGTTIQFNQPAQYLGFLLVAIASSFLIMLALVSPRLGRLFSLAPLRTLGRYSYFIYLVHMPILLVLDQIAVWQGFWHWLAYYLLVTVGLVGIGALAWQFFEHPIIEWNKRRERVLAQRASL
jgi:peptidoglycan/LPS O-acetylase OafA/YrhL